MREPWADILSRICADAPVDLDAAAPPRKARGRAEGKCLPIPGAPGPGPSARLWDRGDEDVSFIGIRVTEAPADPVGPAVRLAAAALERGVVPVILTTLDATGFEQFGFRVERLPAGSPEERAAAEREIARFWDLAIVIDLADAAGLG